MGKTEDLRQKLIGEVALTEELLKNRDITQDQYNTVIQFLKAEINKYDRRGGYVGFDEASKAIQSQSREDIKKYYGIDVSTFMSQFGSFVTDQRMPNNVIAMRGGMSPLNWKYGAWDYEREMTNRWSDDAPESLGETSVYITNVGVSYSQDLSDLNDIDVDDSVAKEIRKAMEEEAAKIFKGQYGSGAAEVIWREYGGIVLCECDDGDCDAQIDITHDEYIHASGHGGYYRVTSADCSYGVLGAYLVERGKNYRVWTKMA